MIVLRSDCPLDRISFTRRAIRDFQRLRPPHGPAAPRRPSPGPPQFETVSNLDVNKLGLLGWRHTAGLAVSWRRGRPSGLETFDPGPWPPFRHVYRHRPPRRGLDEF